MGVSSMVKKPRVCPSIEWLLHALVASFFDCAKKPIAKLAEAASADHDQVGRRASALVARLNRDDAWVRTYKANWNAMPPWDKRAVIWAGSILPSGEQIAWKNMIGSADPLDATVAAKALHVPPLPRPPAPKPAGVPAPAPAKPTAPPKA